MSKASPVVKAVLSAMYRSYDHESTRRLIAAEILEALANHIPHPIQVGVPIDHWMPDQRTRHELSNIAKELRGQS